MTPDSTAHDAQAPCDCHPASSARTDAPCPDCNGTGSVVCTMTAKNDPDAMRATWKAPCERCKVPAPGGGVPADLPDEQIEAGADALRPYTSIHSQEARRDMARRVLRAAVPSHTEETPHG